ncbi:MAG: MraY family glycosyltransferase [Patescibacteria group bacterium]
MNYILALVSAIILSCLITPICRFLAYRLDIVDNPGVEARKQHGRRVAYLGGLAIAVTFILIVWRVYPDFSSLTWVLAGLVVVVVIGLVDDILGMKPWQKLIGQILVGIILVEAGVGISTFPLPWGGYIDLNVWQIDLAVVGINYSFFGWSALFTIGWTVFLMNALNFLDGVDGLASGVSSIAFLMIFFLSTAAYVNQPLVALLALIMVGAIWGFLPYNLPPATIFLGDSGSMMFGYMLSVLSIFSGGKVATLTLVLGIVILDTILVVFNRMKMKKQVWLADRLHLHFQLLDRGWSAWQVLLLYFLMSLGLGLTALFLPYIWVKIVIWLAFVLYFFVFIYRYANKSGE